MKIKLPNHRSLFLWLGDRNLARIASNSSKILFIATLLVILIGILMTAFSAYKLILEMRVRSGLLEQPEIKPAKSAFFRRVNIRQIEQQKLFGALAPAKTKIEAPVAVEKPKLNLIATFVNARHKYAILESGSSQVQEAFEEGEKVFNVATLLAIERGRVKLKWPDGSEDVLEIEENFVSGATVPTSSERAGSVRRISLSRMTLNEFLDDVTVFATQARVIPFFQDGKPVGLRIFGISTGGVYEFLGFENGDIVKSIDNTPVVNVTDFTNLVKQLKEKSRIVILIERNRENVELVYDIN